MQPSRFNQFIYTLVLIALACLYVDFLLWSYT